MHQIINAPNPVEAIKSSFKIQKNKKFNDNVEDFIYIDCYFRYWRISFQSLILNN